MNKILGTFLSAALPYIIGGAALIFGGFYVYNYLQTNYGPGTPDPGGGAPATSTLGGLENAFLEIGGPSSESFQAAATATTTNTTQTLDTIAGGNQGGTAFVQGNNPNDPTGIARVWNNLFASNSPDVSQSAM